MTWRNEEQWNKSFVKWIESNPVYKKHFDVDKLRPTYTSEFSRWSIAEEAFVAGVIAERATK